MAIPPVSTTTVADAKIVPARSVAYSLEGGELMGTYRRLQSHRWILSLPNPREGRQSPAQDSARLLSRPT